jgi:hypothetical protein
MITEINWAAFNCIDSEKLFANYKYWQLKSGLWDPNIIKDIRDCNIFDKNGGQLQSFTAWIQSIPQIVFSKN